MLTCQPLTFLWPKQITWPNSPSFMVGTVHSHVKRCGMEGRWKNNVIYQLTLFSFELKQKSITLFETLEDSIESDKPSGFECWLFH